MMLINGLKTLRRNPVLIPLYLLYILIIGAAAFFLIPHRIEQEDMLALLITVAIFLLFAFVSLLVGLVFLSGYGHMLAEAVTKGTTSIGSFPAGIAKFFVKLLLAVLLLFAIYIGFSIVLAMAVVPVSLILAMGRLTEISTVNVVNTLIISIAAVISIPFIVSWIPAIFIDGAGVVDGLKAALRAGVRNYGVLLLWTVILYAPSLAYTQFSMTSLNTGEIFTPWYFAVAAVTSVLSLIYLPALFELYHKKGRPAAMPDPGGRPS
jgi:hypothetical protein